MKTPVIAIGLDAADPTLIEKWISSGHLKTLAHLREQGAYTRLNNLEHYRAETPWTTFLTGCSPTKTGYWAPLKLFEGTYTVKEFGAYDFKEYSPFYALGDDYRVAVFDMPQARIANQVNGVQVLAWGAHSALTPSCSQPASLYQEILNEYGEHPAFNQDHASVRDLAEMKALQKKLEIGIARRAAICKDILEQDQWDLLLTVFGEPHSAGHFFWHLSDRNHPLYDEIGAKAASDALLDCFIAIDRAIETLIAAAPKNAHIVVFAAHGMDANVMDLPSMLFLPELLYRWNFPGQFGLARGEVGAPVDKPVTANRRDWLGEVWRSKYESHSIRQFLRRKAPVKVFNLLDKLFGMAPEKDLISPYQLVDEKEEMFFQPAMWYQKFWPEMKAFALPSYSEGYIRINLKGREPQGVVEPSQYHAVCDELTRMLLSLKDARTGKSMVKEIVRTREAAIDNDPKLPDADLVIIWQEGSVTDTVECPTLGRIGPVPYLRTGSHRSHGFFLGVGPNIPAQSPLPVAHALDLTPTLLSLMGAPIPDYFEGRSLIKSSVPVKSESSEAIAFT